MSKFERWVFQWLLDRLVHGGAYSGSNIREIYRMTRKQAHRLYREDTPHSIDSFLQDTFDKAMAAPSHTTNKEKGGADGHVLDR